MPNDDLASSNVGRSYSLAGTSIAIFTFTLVFLYPKYAAGEINGDLFQATLVVMAMATFALSVAAVHYYGSSLTDRVDDHMRAVLARRADMLWTIGYTLLFGAPSLILFSVGLNIVGAIWVGLWLVATLWGLRQFGGFWTKRVTPPRD